MSMLNECTWQNTKPYLPNFTQGKCIKVYDADTVTIAAEVNGLFYRFQIRLFGIDAPELKAADQLEKEKAKIARDKLAQLLLNQIVSVHILNSDKYGRLLAKVVTNAGVDVSEYLLNNNFAVPYDGSTKTPWTSEMLNRVL